MGNRRLYKIEHFHALGTSESERLKVTALNLFHPTAPPRLPKDRFLYVATQPLCEVPHVQRAVYLIP